MGVMTFMSGLGALLFGGGRNVVADTAAAFAPNAEAADQRAADTRQKAMAEFAAEFASATAGGGIFGRVVDAMNRLPRPLMAFGVIGLFGSAMWSPVWFSARMQGLALVPDQLWWLLGAIVSFYFGAREIAYSRQAGMAKAALQIAQRAPAVVQTIQAIQTGEETPGSASLPLTAASPQADQNAAVDDWRSVISGEGKS